ncbi:hypothetical protein Ocin01_04909 [Orchesella cincta]|uniref:Uncharacterized protein n=1 Tax=Orchesella cincta TaxID=48709 RepID=A0A1D2N954_ORCCI|nr:hypothetical protein Ocin01_04909 [Orchesella cincta]
MWKQQLHIPYCTLYHQRAKMRYSVEIVLVIFGCAITLTTARSITQASHTRTVRSPAEDDPAGTPQAIRAKPENTKGYIAFAKNNFQGIDDIMDKHFSKKKEEGENIIKAGEETQVVVKSGTDTMEKEHYDLMQKAFEGFNTARSSALEELMQGEDDLSSGGSMSVVAELLPNQRLHLQKILTGTLMKLGQKLRMLRLQQQKPPCRSFPCRSSC